MLIVSSNVLEIRLVRYSLLHNDQMSLFSGMEAGYTVRFVRDPYHHSGCDLLQYTQEGRLAHREDARSSLHRVRYGKYTIITLRFEKRSVQCG